MGANTASLVWLFHAFVRPDSVEVSSGIRMCLRMLFTSVFMLFAVQREWDVRVGELWERYFDEGAVASSANRVS